MSRRSLRLDEGLLDRNLPHSSTSFSVGGTDWRSTRSLKSRRSQQLSVSCSESLLLLTPRPSLLNSSVHSVASDASLLSSLLDDSSVQENTLVESFWGLDHDVDPSESTIVAEQSAVIGCPKHLVQTSRVHCPDCDVDRKESTYCSSSRYTPTSSCTSSCSLLTRPGHSQPTETETSTVYCRDRSRKSRTGVLQSVWTCVLSLLSLHKHQDVKARSGLCGVMDLRGTASNQKELHPNGSLCEAYRWISRRWHHMTSSFLLTLSPLRLLLLLLPLLLLLFTLCLFCPAALQSVNISNVPTLSSIVSGFTSSHSRPAEGAVEEAREVQAYVEEAREVQAYVEEAREVQAYVEEAREVQAYVEEALYSGPPAARDEEEPAAADESDRFVHLEQSLTELWQRVEAGGQRAEQRHMELLQLYAALQQLVSDQGAGEAEDQGAGEAEDQGAGEAVDQGAGEAVDQGAGEAVEPWLSRLLDQQLQQIRRRLDEETRHREQSQQQEVLQQQSQTSRLDQLELQLQTLAARTEELQRRREAAETTTPPAAVSVGVDHQSHDALLAEVARLEATLEDVRRDVEGLSGCEAGCRQLDTIQHTISAQVVAQVREEVRALVYGNQLTVGGGASCEEGGAGGEEAAGLSESLLQWLSQRYVSGDDLQAALASLELSILQNVSLQLQQRRHHAATDAVLHAAGAAGAAITQEDVHVIVKNALRLFSEDRTGLADYALESGGGSVISTRCSETYETKAALLSLFGLPLWYFSQSPRVVIQPDVHPGNCWAFRGSRGFLVIRLSMRVRPSAFSLEHIPKTLAPSGALHSAPRDFSVYGLDDESEERGTLLGSYTYNQDGDSLQTYSVTEENERAFQIIEVQVFSNWGHQEYTCMYRFRVHGTPQDA